MRDQNARAENRDRSRLAIADRLFREGLYDESNKLRFCGEEFDLMCTGCGESTLLPKTCKRRWCPECSWFRGLELVEKYLAIVAKLRWPLMLTLTIPHHPGNDPAEMLDVLKNGLKKMKRLKWWKDRVRGGLGAIEISGSGTGWHIHAHLLIDCEWLAVTTATPRAGMSRMARTSCFKSSQREVASQWGLCAGFDDAHIWIKRADKSSIYEALKYAVKPGTLEKIKLPLRPLIEGFKKRRLVDGWGTVRKMAKLALKEKREEKKEFTCKCGCSDWMPGTIYDSIIRDFRQRAPANSYRELCKANRERERERKVKQEKGTRGKAR